MRSRRLRRAGGALLLTLFIGACGGNDNVGQPTVTVRGPADAGLTTLATTPGAPKAAPRWEQLAAFTGSGPTDTATFTVAPGAIQWRVTWTCDTGTLKMTPEPPLKKPRLLVSGACKARGEDYAIEPGEHRLKVEATGPWTATVDQQVDTPVSEAPLPEMATAPVLLSGGFHDIERTGKGTARLYQLPGGRRALRLEDFEVSQNTELYVWLSEAPDPRTSADTVAVPHFQLAGLTSTVGSQNYELPADLPTSKIHSIVIWCAPVRIAYTAASLAAP